MEIKGKCRAGIRRRKLDIQNSETQEWDSWNSPFRLKRQSRARVAPYIRESCEMHEMMKRRSRFRATVNQTTSTQTKGKSRQLKLGESWPTLKRSHGRQPRRTRGIRYRRYRSIKMIRSNPIKSDQIKPNPIKKTVQPASRRRPFGQD